MMYLGGAILLLVLYVIFKEFTWKAQPWPKDSLVVTKYQGHRGYWKGGKQENTMESFSAALERGHQMVELDVRLSKDQVPVLFHDDDLNRLAHRSEHVADLTAAELKQYAQAPSLEEVLGHSHWNLFFNIELKTDKAFDGTLEEKIAEVIQRTGTAKRILFSSFNPLAIYRLSKLLPQIPRALLVTDEDHERNKIYLRRMWLAPFVNLNALHLDSQYVTPADVARWKKRGVPVALWTVNDTAKANDYLKSGAISIISDELFQ
jgi:Glycerophosphoryl diester phosphodiesterase